MQSITKARSSHIPKRHIFNKKTKQPEPDLRTPLFVYAEQQAERERKKAKKEKKDNKQKKIKDYANKFNSCMTAVIQDHFDWSFLMTKKGNSKKRAGQESKDICLPENEKTSLIDAFKKGEKRFRQACVDIKNFCGKKEVSPKEIINKEFSEILSAATYYRQIAGHEADTVLKDYIDFVPAELAVLITPKKVPVEDVIKVWKIACKGKGLPTKNQLIDAIKTYKDRKVFKEMIVDKKTIIDFFASKNTKEAETIIRTLTDANKQARKIRKSKKLKTA